MEEVSASISITRAQRAHEDSRSARRTKSDREQKRPRDGKDWVAISNVKSEGRKLVRV